MADELNCAEGTGSTSRGAIGSGSDSSALPFDVVFADTCVGGSTVASQLARTRRGFRAFYLADYAVNPLGVKSKEAVQGALDRWVDAAVGRAGELIIACNTASVRLRGVPEVVGRARTLGVSVHSMSDFLERMLVERRMDVRGKRVCLMGTEFTVGQPLYRDRLIDAGASSVIPLAATRTERAIAYLEHDTAWGREAIMEGEGPNRLTVALTGDVFSTEGLCAQFPKLFPGWELEGVLMGEVEER